MLSRKINRAFFRLQALGFEPTGVLDIGAYQGGFGALARSVFKGAHIVMVDPLPTQAEQLTGIAAHIGNAEYKPGLLGECVKTVDFHTIDTVKHPEFNATGSSKYRENNNYPFETIQMEQTTLDNLLAGDTHKYELLKLDVQGAELDVLAGATERLKDVEVILMEISLLNYNENAPLLHDVLSKMSEFGFVLFDIADEHRIGQNDHLFQVDGIFLRPNSKYRPQPPFFTTHQG
jgi:FkbM family methyltransferase